MNTFTRPFTWISALSISSILLTSFLPSTLAGSLESKCFGFLPSGESVTLYTLKNDSGFTVKVTDYGATITEIHAPDKNGNLGNVALGFENLEQYLGGHPAFGNTIGRFANRISNASFPLNGETIQVTPNAGKNHIHGGNKGFNRVLWKGTPITSDPANPAVRFSYLSKDGEEGYPGNLQVHVTFSVSNDNTLTLEYQATSDKDTILNLTNHSYFNLNGSGNVLDHRLQIFSDFNTPTDSSLIPTGEIARVSGTALDFTEPRAIGERIATFYPNPGGYDHNFIVRGTPGTLRLAAIASSPSSGRQLKCWTTEPAVQLYTANWSQARLTGVGGISYGQHCGFCLETQHYPDSPNQAHFPTTTLKANALFQSQTRYQFTTQ